MISHQRRDRLFAKLDLQWEYRDYLQRNKGKKITKTSGLYIV
jgi:hypothetical protein